MEIDVGGLTGDVSVEKSDQIEMQTMRIFIGGLGEAVTDDDLRRMFVALGSVDEIEIIRTKGRSIAYLNFTPSSAKSLAKLFSSFNGCVWKGGRLRIEKAKEHYLVKMEREQEQEREEELARNDVKLKCSAASAAEVVSLRKPIKGPGAEKEQIRIFFPKLRKVKPLPFGGCGKHKYSFRNIQVPSLPTHFCDCEIHSVPYDAPIGNTVINHDAPQSGVDEKEFDLMKSVLNKFISNDEYSSVKAVSDGPGGNVSPPRVLNDILPSEENATNSEPDEDGIVMNISGGLNEMDFSWKSENKTVAVNQEPRGNHLQALEIDVKMGSNKEQKLENKNNKVTSNATQKEKKVDFNVSVLSQGNNPLRNRKSKWKELVSQGSDSSFKLSNVLSSGSAHDLVQQEDVKEDLSESEETEDEMEASTDESAQQADTDEESNELEEPDNEDEEPPDESAEMDTEEESNKSEELDAEAEPSAEESSHQEDSEQVSNEFEDRDGLEEASTEDFGSESTQDSVENDEDEVESTNSDEQDNLMKTELSNDSSLIHQNAFEQPPLKSGENERQEGVKPSETEDGSVKFKKGATWSQKMPWTRLVSDMDNSSFSISQIIPNHPTGNQVTANPNLMSKDVSTCQSSKAVLSKTDADSAFSFTNTPTDLHEQENLNSSGNHSGSCNPSRAIKSEEKKPTTTQEGSAHKQATDVKTEVREIRPFVRSADSVKEWKKLKKALSRSQTKKRKTVDQEQ